MNRSLSQHDLPIFSWEGSSSPTSQVLVLYSHSFVCSYIFQLVHASLDQPLLNQPSHFSTGTSLCGHAYWIDHCYILHPHGCGSHWCRDLNCWATDLDWLGLVILLCIHIHWGLGLLAWSGASPSPFCWLGMCFQPGLCSPPSTCDLPSWPILLGMSQLATMQIVPPMPHKSTLWEEHLPLALEGASPTSHLGSCMMMVHIWFLFALAYYNP